MGDRGGGEPDGADKLTGTPGRDVVVLRGGSDQVSATDSGHDLIVGRPGDDNLASATLTADLRPGPGNDWVLERDLTSSIRLGPGDDVPRLSHLKRDPWRPWR